MAKTVFKAEIDYLRIPLEGIQLKYRLLAGSTKKKPQLEVEELLYDKRDIRFLLSQKQLDEMALTDYIKQTQGKEIE